MDKTKKEKLPKKEKKYQVDYGKVLLVWEDFERPFKKRSREYYSTIGVIVLLISVIFFFAREFLLIGVTWSLAFFGYVVGSVKPNKISYKIAEYGVVIGEKAFLYTLMGRFWFDERAGKRVLLIEHFGGFPSQLVLVLGKDIQEENVEELLKKYLLHQEPEKSRIDKMGNWLREKVPLES